MSFKIIIGIRENGENVFRIENMANNCYLEFVGITKEMRLGVLICNHSVEIMSQNFVDTKKIKNNFNFV